MTLRARIHWHLHHRHPFHPCHIHCGCDCAGLRVPCEHVEFTTYLGCCAHCGYGRLPSGGSK